MRSEVDGGHSPEVQLRHIQTVGNALGQNRPRLGEVRKPTDAIAAVVQVGPDIDDDSPIRIFALLFAEKRKQFIPIGVIKVDVVPAQTSTKKS
jgi:hypothetical protein